ncbi:MAG: hypothetical protein WBO36_00795, partial [Saprospiraceae bacterium]
MSEEISPVWREQKSQRLQDIVFAAERSQTTEVKISAGEAKRIELIRKMKNDTDKQEYMIMFNGLMIALSISALCHFIFYGSNFSMFCFVVSLVYFFYIRKRLTSATLQLMEYKNNFDKYLWEGFYLKEMRYSAV